MVIIKLMGGLGNQLQQYALYEKMLILGKEASIDTTWFEDPAVQEVMLAPRNLELNYFDDLTFRKATEQEIVDVCGKGSFIKKLVRKLRPDVHSHFYERDMYHPQIFAMDTVYLEGYWAAEKYYADILPILREKIHFPKCSEANLKMAADIRNTPYSVCMHIRRGDYLDSVNQKVFGGICTEMYYKEAVEYIKKFHANAVFYIFSDDPQYVTEHYRGGEYIPVNINHGIDSFFDIWLMSQCDAHICANSTFSFWGARLNEKKDKIMIRPSIHKNSQVFVPEEMHDLWPGWVLMDPGGKVV